MLISLKLYPSIGGNFGIEKGLIGAQGHLRQLADMLHTCQCTRMLIESVQLTQLLTPQGHAEAMHLHISGILSALVLRNLDVLLCVGSPYIVTICTASHR